MTPNIGALFVFTKDDDLDVFVSVGDAAASMEAVDVDAGEYPALFTLDGRRVTAGTVNGQVQLLVSQHHDEAALRERLRRYEQRVALVSSPDDPRAVANELLRWKWEHRWPKRPGWLSRRLHGTGPLQV